MIEPNVKTVFNPEVRNPEVHETAFVHALAAVVGNVSIGRNVFVAPGASVRGDEGQPLHVSEDSNVQDGVVIHALETWANGVPIEANLRAVEGRRYAVYVGRRVSLAHQAQIHGPAVVLHDTFVGMKALVFKATVGQNCVIEPGAIVMNVAVPDGRYVTAGRVLTDQSDADGLPRIDSDYPFRSLNRGVVAVNIALAAGYLARSLSRKA